MTRSPLLACVAVLAPAAPALAEPEDHVRVGAFMQADARYFADDDKNLYVDQLTFRSLRVQLDANLDAHHVDVRILPDFAGGKLVVQDGYADLHYLRGITLRVGKQKVPFGLERLQTEGTTILAERGLPTQVAPNRDLGAALYGEPWPWLSWQLGIFDGVPDGALTDGDASDHKEGAARIVVRPLPCWGPSQGLQLGGAATYGHAYGTLAAPDLPAYRMSGQAAFAAFPVGTTLADTAVASGCAGVRPRRRRGSAARSARWRSTCAARRA